MNMFEGGSVYSSGSTGEGSHTRLIWIWRSVRWTAWDCLKRGIHGLGLQARLLASSVRNTATYTINLPWLYIRQFPRGRSQNGVQTSSDHLKQQPTAINTSWLPQTISPSGRRRSLCEKSREKPLLDFSVTISYTGSGSRRGLSRIMDQTSGTRASTDSSRSLRSSGSTPLPGTHSLMA